MQDLSCDDACKCRQRGQGVPGGSEKHHGAKCYGQASLYGWIPENRVIKHERSELRIFDCNRAQLVAHPCGAECE